MPVRIENRMRTWAVNDRERIRGRRGGRGREAETASLNNILRQCKERLLGHYRRSLTILAIWLGQCLRQRSRFSLLFSAYFPFPPSHISTLTHHFRSVPFMHSALLAANNSFSPSPSIIRNSKSNREKQEREFAAFLFFLSSPSLSLPFFEDRRHNGAQGFKFDDVLIRTNGKAEITDPFHRGDFR